MIQRAMRLLIYLSLVAAFCLGALPTAAVVHAQAGAPPGLPVGVEVTTDAHGNVTFVSGPFTLPAEVQSAEVGASTAALAFVQQYATLFGIANPLQELRVTATEADALGLEHVALAQMAGDVQVYGAGMRVHLRSATGEVTAASSSYLPGIQPPTVPPAIDAQGALALARRLLPAGELVRQPELVIYPGVGSKRTPAGAQLAWLVELRDVSVPARGVYVLRADTGALLDVLDRLYINDGGDRSVTATPPSLPVAQVEPAVPSQPDIVGGEEAEPGAYPWMAAIVSSGVANAYDGQFFQTD